MLSIWRLLWQMLRYAQRLYSIDALLWLFILGLPIVPGILIREFFNSLTDQSRFDLGAWVWIGLLLAAGLARVIAILVGRITKTQHRFLMSGLVRHNLFIELLKRPGTELATGRADGPKASPGEILSYFRDDAFQIEDTVVGTNEIFAAGVFAIASVILLLSVNPTMTLLVFLPLCAIATLAHYAEHRLKRYRQASRYATQQVTGLLGEMFTAVQAVKVAGAETRMLNELRERCDRRRQAMLQDQVFNALLNSGFENIVSIGIGFILLLASQSLGAQGDLTVGDFALFVYYLSFVTNFLGFLGSFLATIKQSEVSFERMTELVGVEEQGSGGAGEQGSRGETRLPTYSPTRQPVNPPTRLPAHSPTHPPISPLTHPHPLYLKPIFGSQPSLPTPPPPPILEPFQELRVEGLTYHYPNCDRGITNISFTLKPGSLVVITGRVGAGKTTLLRVLLGLLPKQSGSIFWNGQQVHDPANFLIPPRAAYTPQIPQLFSASLRDNLLLGLDTTVTTDQLTKAIATAVFDQDLAALPNGLDTLVGTRGFRLSGGQKQRVAAARMLLRQPQLFVFDDLSSALDVETEQRLWERLLESRRAGERGSRGAEEKISYPPTHPPTHPSTPLPTCLVVSHRPSVLKLADQVLLLESGRIHVSGSPEDLSGQLGNL